MMRFAGIVLSAALLQGCGSEGYTGIENAGPFDHLHFRSKTSPPGAADLSPNFICIQQGIAIKARVSALDSVGRPLPVLDLTSRNPNVFEAERGPSIGNYVFYGIEPGSTELAVTSRGVYRDSVPVMVIPAADDFGCPP